ncbi:MAG: branched-chain amino acid aminotransferase [Alphaproteobacteria bacterium]|nr:branched-chain amino acid aminotransferase [Alphaproteobacteria bacterium]
MLNESFENRSGIIWMDGKLIPWKDAKLHVLTHSLHYGSAVFEGSRAYNGTVFKLKEHNERLHKSAELLGYKIPYSVEILNKATIELLKANHLKDAYIRPVAWYSGDSLSLGAPASKVHVVIAAWVWKSYFQQNGTTNKGLKLMWAPWVRPAPTMAPVAAKAAGLYITGTLSKHQAGQKGFDDALMLDYRGFIAECTGANVFMVKKGELHTPLADCFLNGITRQTVISLAKDLGIPVHERHIKPEELNEIDEMFVTGTAAEIVPVSQIADIHIKSGPITEKLMHAYMQLVRKPPRE